MLCSDWYKSDNEVSKEDAARMTEGEYCGSFCKYNPNVNFYANLQDGVDAGFTIKDQISSAYINDP